MFLTRKFYNTDAPADAGGGAAETVVEQPPMSIAEAMAKNGRKSDENSTAPKPIDIGTLTVPKAEEPTPAATVKEEEPAKAVEEPKTEPVKEEPKKEEPTPIAKVEPQKEVTLDEVLKKNQPDTILKALGFDDKKVAFIQELGDIDDKVVGIVQAWKNGQLGDYINALGTDYTKMSDVDVMRNQLRKEYPKVSDAAFEALFEDEVLDKYKLDDSVYSETEVAKGKLLLEAKAARYRDELVANQEKFLMPKPPEPKAPAVPDNTAELQAQKAKEDVEAYVKEIKEDPYTKNIIADKKITLGEGEEKFGFPVDPELLIGVMTDPQKIADAMLKKVVGADGKEALVLDTEKQMLSAAIQVYGKPFLDAYAVHIKGLGGKAVTDLLENAKPKDGTVPAKSEAAPTTVAGAMAKHGRRVDPVV